MTDQAENLRAGALPLIKNLGDGTYVPYVEALGGTITLNPAFSDGADVTQGALADAAVVSDASGSLSAKLRGLVKILASVWDSTRNVLAVAEGGSISAISASTAVKASAGRAVGFLCAASSAGVITVYDNASAASGTKLVDALPVIAGQFYPVLGNFANGLYVSIDSGTAKLSVYYV